MKKLKRIAAFTLAIALVVCVCLIPASAVTDTITLEETFNGKEREYDYYGYLKMNLDNNEGTACLTSAYDGSGLATANVSARLEGTIYSNTDAIVPLYKEDYNFNNQPITIYDSGVLGSGLTFRYVECTYIGSTVLK